MVKSMHIKLPNMSDIYIHQYILNVSYGSNFVDNMQLWLIQKIYAYVDIYNIYNEQDVQEELEMDSMFLNNRIYVPCTVNFMLHCA